MTTLNYFTKKVLKIEIEMVWLEVRRSVMDISADAWTSQGPGW